MSALGYVTIADLAEHLGEDLFEETRRSALTKIAAAEAVVIRETNGRLFLPLLAALSEEIDEDDTTLVLTDAFRRFPSGGTLHIGDEAISYTRATAGDDSTVTLSGVTRGVGGTTPAAYEAATEVHSIRGFACEALSLYPGEFLDLHALWTGWDLWSSYDLSNVRPRPNNASPYQWIAAGDGNEVWGRGIHVWVSATWGFSWEVPPEIKWAVLRIVEDGLLRQGRATSVIASETIEGHERVYRPPSYVPPDVAEVLHGFRRARV